jgi:hypothetical protein
MTREQKITKRKERKQRRIDKKRDYTSYDGCGYLRVERLVTVYNHDCKIYLSTKYKDRLPEEFFDLNKYGHGK